MCTYKQVGLSQDHVMKSRVLSELLFKDDQLVNDLSDSLETTSVKGGCVHRDRV